MLESWSGIEFWMESRPFRRPPVAVTSVRFSVYRAFVWLFWAGFSMLLGYGVARLLDRPQEWREDSQLIAVHGTRQSLDLPSRAGDVPAEDERFAFEAVPETGLAWSYDHGGNGEFHLAETLGGGVGLADWDRDGRLDIIATDGGDPLNWPENRQNRLGVFRQSTPTDFMLVSAEARASFLGYAHGCAVGDVDGDGFDDFFVTGYQSAALFLNRGDGTFQDVTASAGLLLDWWSATASFGDLDRDGDLDLYVTGYADVSRDLPTRYCESGGQRIHCHPHYYDPIPDAVFENLGDGSFADRTASSGVADYREYGLGVVIVDLDQDLSPEIYVADDGDRNLLFSVRDQWKFQESALTAGVAFNGEGRSMGSMGIACGEFNRDGLLDLTVTNFSDERNVVYENAGALNFVDRSLGSEFDMSSRRLVGWAAVPLDVDRDGTLDLFVANGHVTPMPGQEYRQRPHLFRGSGDGEWLLSDPGGGYFTIPRQARGAASADLDRDLRPDLVVSQIREPVTVLRNQTQPVGGAAELQLVGVKSNRPGANVRIEFVAGSQRFTHEVQLSAGYLSSVSAPVILSWPAGQPAQAVRIVWPSGVEQTIPSLEAGQRMIIVEGISSLTLAAPH